MVQKYYNVKIKSILIYISMFLLCLTTGSVIEGFNRMGMFLLYVGSVLFLFIVFGTKCIFTRREFGRFAIFFIFVFLFYGIFGNYIRRDFTVYMFLLRLLVTYSFVTFVTYDIFRIYFYKIIKFICIYAMVTFFLQFIISPLSLPWCSWFPVVRTFHGLLNYGAKETIIGISIYRNQGLFTEPGILSVYGSIGLLIAYKENGYKSKILFLATLISTFSTTGLIIIFVFVIFYIFDKRKYHYIIFLLPFLFAGIFYSFTAKMDLKKTYSGAQRITDIYFCIKVFLKNWYLGVGFSEDNYIHAVETIEAPRAMKAIAGMLYNRGSSNGLLVIFAKTGIIFGLLYISLLKNQKIIKIEKNRLIIVLCLCLVGEPLAFSSLFLVFIASGIVCRKRRY